MLELIAGLFGALKEIFGYLKQDQLIEAGRKEAELDALRIYEEVREAAANYTPPDDPLGMLLKPSDRSDTE